MAVMEQNAAKPQGGAFSDGVRLYVWAIVILVIAELIGAISISAGHGKIVLLPMVWALLLGAALGLAVEQGHSPGQRAAGKAPGSLLRCGQRRGGRA